MGEKEFSCAVIIPALNPGQELPGYVRSLLERGIPAVIVVDDGSRADCAPIFSAVEEMSGTIVLHHAVNRGKGVALKTAYRYCLDTPALSEIAGVVTADADGQHHVEDVLRVAKLTQEKPGSIIMGTRNLRLPNVPPRSKLGNRLTSFGFHMLYGARLEDTQTGLRGFPRGLLDWCCGVRGERFEYEMNVLIRAVGEGIPFEQTEIQTIYYDNNKGSHLRAGRDSWRVFLVLMSGLGIYAVAAAVSAAVDVGMFWVSYRFIFASLSRETCYLWSTILARVLSSVINFLLNRKYVFRSVRGHMDSLWRYYTLWTVQMLASYLGLLALGAILRWPAVVLKAIVDILLAIGSYQIQLRWVFRDSK